MPISKNHPGRLDSPLQTSREGVSLVKADPLPRHLRAVVFLAPILLQQHPRGQACLVQVPIPPLHRGQVCSAVHLRQVRHKAHPFSGPAEVEAVVIATCLEVAANRHQAHSTPAKMLPADFLALARRH